VLVAEGAQLAQERGGSGVEAAFALDRLDDDRRHRRRRDLVAEQRPEGTHRTGGRRLLVVAEVAVDVGERRQVDRRQERFVAEPVVDARAGDRGGAEGPAVEGAPEGDDAGPPGDAAGELERGLDRLGAGVAEEDRVERIRADVGQHALPAADRLEVAERVADVEQLVGLVLDRGRDRRMVVAQRGRGDAAGEVQEAASGRVVEGVALAMAPAGS
jgi:hypothetical protein